MDKIILKSITVLFFIFVLIGLTIFISLYTSNKNTKSTVPAGVVIDAEITSITDKVVRADIGNRHREVQNGEVNRFKNNLPRVRNEKKRRLL